MTRAERTGVAMVACAALGWGPWSLFLRPAEAASHVSPATEAFVVELAAFVVALPWALQRRRRSVKRPLAAWGTASAAGAADALSTLLFFASMAHTNLAIANLTHYMAPTLVALAHPRRTWGVVLPTLTALAGLALVLGSGSQGDSAGWLGGVFGALSAVFFAAHILLSDKAAAHFNAYENLAWQRPASMALLIPALPAHALLMSPEAAVHLVAGGVIIAGMAGMIFLGGIARAGAGQAAVLTLLEPVSAVFIGWAVWQERLSATSCLGVVIVLCSICMVVKNDSCK